MEKITRKKEAYGILLQISIDYGKNVNDLLLAAKETLGERDFNALKRLAATGLGDVFARVMTPIIHEYPDLKPQWLDDKD